MKVQSVTIKNFRKLENVEQQINGSNLILLGENAVGKSSFIKAIMIALGDTSLAGVDQVTHGKKESSIKVITDDKGEKYTFEAKFKAGSDKPIISVTAENGLKQTSKSVIGNIVGSLDFDIDAFVEMSKSEKGRKEQVEIVKSFMPEEIRNDLAKHERMTKTMYDDRTEVNRQIKTIDGFIKEAGLSEDDILKYQFEEKTDKITEEINEAIKHNQNVQKGESALSEIVKENTASDQLIKNLEAQIAQEKEKINGKVAKAMEIEKWLLANKAKDISAIQQKLKDATDHNLMHQKVNDVRTQIQKKEELEKESESFTVQIETIRQLVSDTIKDLDSPVEGLSFTDDNLMYNGAIVDESTLSTSEIMMLGVKLKMAKNPNVRVLCIERGESLGAQKLKDLQKMAKDYDFQIIMEQVERGTEKLVIEIMPELETVPV